MMHHPSGPNVLVSMTRHIVAMNAELEPENVTEVIVLGDMLDLIEDFSVDH